MTDSTCMGCGRDVSEHDHLARCPAPSPASPAGTERERIEAAFELAIVDDLQALPTYAFAGRLYVPRESVRALLRDLAAAVVSSSPATPEGGRGTPEWEAWVLEPIRARSASPATPAEDDAAKWRRIAEQEFESGNVWCERALAAEAALQRARDLTDKAVRMADGRGITQVRAFDLRAALASPATPEGGDTADLLNLMGSGDVKAVREVLARHTPSPASPAETREGREWQPSKYQAALLEAFTRIAGRRAGKGSAHFRHGYECGRDDAQRIVAEVGWGAANAPTRAASPAVSLPGEAEKS